MWVRQRKWRPQRAKKVERFKERENWLWQVEGWFELREVPTGRIFVGKGFSTLFKDLRDKEKYHREALHHALYRAGGTNWSVLHSHYEVIKWKNIV